jgi:hypothetical protein
LATGSAFQFNGTDLGLGVTPSVNTVSGSGYRQIEVGTSIGNMIFAGGNEMLVVQNAIYNSGFKYAQSTQASYFRLNAGQHQFFTAPSGTAGNAITFTQAMTLDASGNLGIGTTTPSTFACLGVNKAVTTGSVLVSAGFSDSSFNTLRITHASGSVGLNFDDTNLIFQSGGTTPTTRMTLNSSGNLGLGVTPSAWGSGTKAFQVGSYGSVNTIGGIDVGIANNAYNDGTNWKYIASQEAAYLKVNRNTFLWNIAAAGTAGTNITFTQAMTLDASGNLLVGTSASIGNGGVFQAKNAANGAVGYFEVLNSAGGVQNALDIVSITNASYTPLRFWVNGYGTTLVGSISCTTGATAYNTSSDYRLKNTITPMTGALAKVAQLKPVTYKWNADGSDGEGFIAHELAEVCPLAVTGDKDAIDADGKPQYQGIDVSFLVATLTAAIQELDAKFEAYKASHP